MIWPYIIQILTACLSSAGFSMIFRIRCAKLPSAALGGGLAWIVYLVCFSFTARPFAAYLSASFFAAAFAEYMAHFWKAPATIFMISSVLPLVPGGSLYYTMSAIVKGSRSDAVRFGIQTGETAGALAFGILLFTAFYHLICNILQLRKF